MNAVINKITGLDLEKRKCVHCGEEFLKEMLTMNKYGEWVCLEHLYAFYTKCEGQCEEFVLDEEIKNTGDGLQCQECRETNGSHYE